MTGEAFEDACAAAGGLRLEPLRVASSRRGTGRPAPSCGRYAWFAAAVAVAEEECERRWRAKVQAWALARMRLRSPSRDFVPVERTPKWYDRPGGIQNEIF
jgi:hypothetical protein